PLVPPNTIDPQSRETIIHAKGARVDHDSIHPNDFRSGEDDGGELVGLRCARRECVRVYVRMQCLPRRIRLRRRRATPPDGSGQPEAENPPDAHARRANSPRGHSTPPTPTHPCARDAASGIRSAEHRWLTRALAEEE